MSVCKSRFLCFAPFCAAFQNWRRADENVLTKKISHRRFRRTHQLSARGHFTVAGEYLSGNDTSSDSSHDWQESPRLIRLSSDPNIPFMIFETECGLDGWRSSLTISVTVEYGTPRRRLISAAVRPSAIIAATSSAWRGVFAGHPRRTPRAWRRRCLRSRAR